MKGYVSIPSNGVMKGSSKFFWFVLTSETLSWYKDDNENEKRTEFPLNGLRLRQESVGILNRRNVLTLYSPEGKSLNKVTISILGSDLRVANLSFRKIRTSNRFQEHKQLVMSFETADEVESWKQGFQRAGVYQDSGFHAFQDAESSVVGRLPVEDSGSADFNGFDPRVSIGPTRGLVHISLFPFHTPICINAKLGFPSD